MTSKPISDDEWMAWRGFRRMAEIIAGRIASDITQATGLSSSDFRVLMHLSDGRDGCRRQRDLQNFLEWDRTRLSHQLTRMAGRGLIERTAGDGKSVMVKMTAEGWRQLAAARPVHAQGVRAYFLELLSDDDLASLRAVTGRLRSRLLDQ